MLDAATHDAVDVITREAAEEDFVGVANAFGHQGGSAPAAAGVLPERVRVLVVRPNANELRAVGVEGQTHNAPPVKPLQHAELGAAVCIPDPNLRAAPHLARRHESAIVRHRQAGDVVPMAEMELLRQGFASPAAQRSIGELGGAAAIGQVRRPVDLEANAHRGGMIDNRAIHGVGDVVLRLEGPEAKDPLQLQRGIGEPGIIRWLIRRGANRAQVRLHRHELVAPDARGEVDLLCIGIDRLAILDAHGVCLVHGVSLEILVPPLKDTSVVASAGHERAVEGAETHVRYVAAVACELLRLGAADEARVPKHFDFAKVVGGRHEAARAGSGDGVDVGTVSLSRPDALDRPAQSACPRRPSGVLQTLRRRDLLPAAHVAEEQLVRAVGGLEVLGVGAEVQVGYVAVVLAEDRPLAQLHLKPSVALASLDGVQVDAIVVRAHGQDPLSRVPNLHLRRRIDPGEAALCVNQLVQAKHAILLLASPPDGSPEADRDEAAIAVVIHRAAHVPGVQEADLLVVQDAPDPQRVVVAHRRELQPERMGREAPQLVLHMPGHQYSKVDLRDVENVLRGACWTQRKATDLRGLATDQ
eukprot:scaffold576_cov260-Pinguiococcus_pyrenoidosus.AAC.45